MHFRRLIIGILFAITVVGCGVHVIDDGWQAPRPLGSDFTARRPSAHVFETNATQEQVEEPTGPLALRDAISLALRSHPELAVSGWEVLVGQARVVQAGLTPNPEFESEQEGIPDGETTLSIGQLVELGGKRGKRRQVAMLERDLAGWDYEAKRLDVYTGVAKAFTEVLAAQEQVTLSERLVELARHVSETVAEQTRAGKVSPIEQIRADVDLASAEIQLRSAEVEEAAARKRLAATWGSSEAHFDRVEGPYGEVTRIPSAEQLTERVSQSPEIARWTVEMAQREASLRLERANRIPDVEIAGGWLHNSETGENAAVASISLPMPLFDRNQGAILEAERDQAKARDERRVSELAVRSALADAYHAIQAAYEEVSRLRADVIPGAQRALDALLEGYANGKFELLEVLDARRTLVEAQTNEVSALLRYHQAVTDIERLIGAPLSSISN